MVVPGAKPDWRQLNSKRRRRGGEMGFWRERLGAGWRTAWACVLAWVAMREGERREMVVFPIFAYVMAVTVVGESRLGKAMEDSVAVATGTFQGVVIPLLLLHLFPFPSLSLAISAIAATSFLAAYPSCLHILHKRIALAHSAIIFLSAAVLSHRFHPVLFPLRLAATTLLGATCGTLALLLPIPHLALLQVSAQAKLSSRITAERLRVLIDAFTARDVTHASALCLQAKSLADMGATAHSELTSSQSNMGWEARRFPWHSAHNLQSVTKGLTSLRKTIVGMELAMQAHLDLLQIQGSTTPTADLPYYGSSSSSCCCIWRHARQREQKKLHLIMQSCLVYLTDWVSLALRHASVTVRQRSSSSTRTHRLVILEEGHEVLCKFDESLSVARHESCCISHMHLPSESPPPSAAFYSAADIDSLLPQALNRDSDNGPHSQYGGANNCPLTHYDDSERGRHYCHRQDNDMNGGHGHGFFCSDHSDMRPGAMYDDVRTQSAYRLEAGNMDLDSYDQILGGIPLLAGASAHSCSMHDTVAAGVTPGTAVTAAETRLHLMNFQAQATSFFFLFNIKMFVERTKSMLSTLDGGPQAAETKNKDLRERSDFEQSIGNLEAMDTSFAAALEGNRRAATTSARLCRKCSRAIAAAGSCTFTSKQKAADVSSSTSAVGAVTRFSRELVSYLSFKPEPSRLLAAFKVSLAMAVGAILGYWFNHNKGYWADITLALGYTGPAKGGSFRVAVLRSLGTVSGSIYGLLVVMATTRLPVLRLLALIPWVLFTSCLRQSRIFGYAGAVSALTGAIVILARTHKDSSDQEFTVIRIVEAFLGMASFIVVEMLVLPRRAAAMVKPEVVSGLADLQKLVSGVFEAICCFSTTPSDGERETIDYCDACMSSSSATAVSDLKMKEEALRRRISRQNALVKEATEEPQFCFDPFPAKIFTRLLEEEGKVVEMLHFAMEALEEIQQVAKETKIPMRRLLRDPLAEAMKVMEEKVGPTLMFLQKAMEGKEQSMVTMKEMGSRTRNEAEVLEEGRLAPAEMQGLMTKRNSRKGNCYSDVGEIAVKRGRRFMEAFERGVREVAEELAEIQERVEAEGAAEIVGGGGLLANTVMLALGSLAFALNELLHHTTQLEKLVHELLQEENPWDLIDFWDTIPNNAQVIEMRP